MIPVILQQEPADFHQRVRQPGYQWLASKGIDLNSVPPKVSDLPHYWTRCNKQLWDAYSGICAYLAIYFEWVTGTSSTDHFVAKSRHAGNAYEWNNYRLSSLAPNRNKGAFDDILDPIDLQTETFILNLANGRIIPNPTLNADYKRSASITIQRLKLDSPDHNSMRARHFSRYLRSKDEQTLKELSPFVWYEAQRQGLL